MGKILSKRITLPGGRIVKTAIAVFLTACICELLNWPAVFAVITATVTIEPTVSDSIKKGIIRFPASAIGSAYTVLFISLFGNSPITYTLSAFFTIATCYRLKLHAGLLVATLTAIAMIEVVHSHYLIAFFIRLGTTTIGLLVSTAINFFVLPPDYKDEIMQNMHSITRKTGCIIEKFFYEQLFLPHEKNKQSRKLMLQLKRRLTRTKELIEFQEDEARFHPLISQEKKLFLSIKNQLEHLTFIHYHLENLFNTSFKHLTFTKAETDLIIKSVQSLAKSLRNIASFNLEKHNQELNLLMELFWKKNEDMLIDNVQRPIYFPPELVFLYELISIYHLVFNMHQKSNGDRDVI